MKKNCAVIFFFIFIIAAVIGSPKSVSFTGSWNTNWGPMEMTQKGGEVMGQYTGQFKGIISGTVSGNRLNFTWSQPNGEHGKGYFIMSDDGNSITGYWGMNESDSDGGSWTGTRTGNGTEP